MSFISINFKRQPEVEESDNIVLYSSSLELKVKGGTLYGMR